MFMPAVSNDWAMSAPTKVYFGVDHELYPFHAHWGDDDLRINLTSRCSSACVFSVSRCVEPEREQ